MVSISGTLSRFDLPGQINHPGIDALLSQDHVAHLNSLLMMRDHHLHKLHIGLVVRGRRCCGRRALGSRWRRGRCRLIRRRIAQHRESAIATTTAAPFARVLALPIPRPFPQVTISVAPFSLHTFDRGGLDIL